MKLIGIVSSSVIALAACGGEANNPVSQGSASQESASQGSASQGSGPRESAPAARVEDGTSERLFAVARQKECGTGACGYWVTPINATVIRCADGTENTRCFVSGLDSSLAPWLAPEVTHPAIGDDGAGVKALVMGSMRQDGASGTTVLLVRRLFAAPTPVPLAGEVFEVKGARGCTEDGCQVAHAIVVNTGEAVGSVAVDLSGAPLAGFCGEAPEPGKSATHRALIVELSHPTAGMLVLAQRTSESTLRVTGYFFEQPFVCSGGIRGRGL